MLLTFSPHLTTAPPIMAGRKRYTRKRGRVSKRRSKPSFRVGNIAGAMPNVPTPYVQKPWNFYTYEVTDTTAAANEVVKTTVNGIVDQIRTRLQLATTATVRIKLLKGWMWCQAGTQLIQPDCESKFFDLSPSRSDAGGGTQFPRSTQRDVGNWDQAAKAGYSFPAIDRREILTSVTNAADDTTVMNTTVVGIGTKVTSRLSLMWQSGAVL